MDKPRILYQYYDLNKKAYEIITNTPDIRTEKIKKIKKFIEKGSYEVKPEKITQSVINDIFLEEILRSQEIIFRLSISVGLTPDLACPSRKPPRSPKLWRSRP